MPDKHEQIQSFYLPAPGVAEVMSVKTMKPGPENATYLEIVVVDGGPVFLFDGRVEGDQAYDRTRGDATEFDLAASATSKSVRGVPQRYGAFTIASDQETVGYVRFYHA